MRRIIQCVVCPLFIGPSLAFGCMRDAPLKVQSDRCTFEVKTEQFSRSPSAQGLLKVRSMADRCGLTAEDISNIESLLTAQMDVIQLSPTAREEIMQKGEKKKACGPTTTLIAGRWLGYILPWGMVTKTGCDKPRC